MSGSHPDAHAGCPDQDCATPRMVSSFNLARLADRPGYRLRIGKYRAVFERNDAAFIILVINIDSRGEIYKRWR